MRHLKKVALLFVAVLMLSISCVPVYASEGGDDGGGNSHIQIDVSGTNGITINPGKYPNLNGTGEAAQEEAATKLVSQGKRIGQTITALCAIVCFVFFLINVTKLSTSGGMAFQRRQAIMGVLWSGAALTLFGGAFTVISLFWNYLD